MSQKLDQWVSFPKLASVVSVLFFVIISEIHASKTLTIFRIFVLYFLFKKNYK